MQRDPRAYLADVLDAADSIQVFTTHRDFEAYGSDLLLRSAVERQFEIMGEALRRLAREDPVLAGRIPDVGRIVSFRNVLAHGYDIVDHEAVWAAITIELPGLVDTVTALLAELDASIAG